MPWALIDLFSENGKASRGAFVMMGAFAATTAVFIYYAVMHWLTDAMYIGYGAMWVIPVVARLIAYSPGAAPSAGSATATATAPGSTATASVPAAAPPPPAPPPS